MYGLNIDPKNPQGDPNPNELRALGVDMVRFTFKDSAEGYAPRRDVVQFYRKQVDALGKVGIKSLIILNDETLSHKPAYMALDQEWHDYIARFAGRAAQIAKMLDRWQPVFQIWNAPDFPNPRPGYEPTLRPQIYGQMLAKAYRAIKSVDPGIRVATAGLVSGRTAWLTRMRKSAGRRLPADILAVNVYSKRPSPNWPTSIWGSGYVGDLIDAYWKAVDVPIWITEIGVDTPDNEFQAEYMRRFYEKTRLNFDYCIEQIFWFCYSDGMASPYGLIDEVEDPKPAYRAFRQMIRATTSPAAVASSLAIPLERLHQFAQYLEQHVVFNRQDRNFQRQIETELRNNYQHLSKLEIQRLTQRLLRGSAWELSETEIESLYMLQEAKDLYDIMRAVVLVTHQRTGALTGRIGVHLPIARETGTNVAANIAALMGVLAGVQPGNRLIVADRVKITANKLHLRGADLFKTNVFGQHRNGLVAGHAWNLQRLIQAIKERGYEDRVILILTIVGSDDGTDIHSFKAEDQETYRLAIHKLIRYLESVAPAVPFKLAFGGRLAISTAQSEDGDGDLSDVSMSLISGISALMKSLARERPDITFICPPLSSKRPEAQLAYYQAFFGDDRPANLTPALQGRGDEAAAQPDQQPNLLEKQAEILRDEGRFQAVSAIKVQAKSFIEDIEALSNNSGFNDVVAWQLLSSDYRTTSEQSQVGRFLIGPDQTDPLAQALAGAVNRTEERILRNIQARGGAALQIVREHISHWPVYKAEYFNHDCPSTMVAGQTVDVEISVRNEGQKSWPANGLNPVKVGYRWFRLDGIPLHRSIWAEHRTNLPHPVLPGETVTVICKVGAPELAGEYEVRLDLVEEQRTWFAWQGAKTLDLKVRVTKP